MMHPEPDTPPEISVSPPPAIESPPLRRPTRHLLIGAGAVAVPLCLCAAICTGLIGAGIARAWAERAPVAAVLDQFMIAMEDRDAEQGYELISTRGKAQMTAAKLEEWLEGNNFALFDGYQDLTVNNINLGKMLATNPDQPQGTVATVNGTIRYEGGYTGQFTAVLEQEAGQWRIFGIQIVAPPDKFGG